MTRLKCLRPVLAPAPVNGWKPDQVRGNRHVRGYGAAWDKLRAQVLERDLGLCQPCQRAGRDTPGTEVDHVIPRSKGGADSLANLVVACVRCNQAKGTDVWDVKIRPRYKEWGKMKHRQDHRPPR